MKVTIHIPISPRGKERARSRIVKPKNGKAFTTHYTPSKTVSYENDVATYAKMAMDFKRPLTGPLKVTLLFIFEAHKAPRWRHEMELNGWISHTSKPDIDNLVKSIFDGFNRVVWLDDQQITKLITEKKYGAEPCIYAVVEEIDKYSAQIKRKP